VLVGYPLSSLQVEDWLTRSSGVSLEELRPYLFLLRDRDATHHLMRVSGGLDSLVMGEGQILAQVGRVCTAMLAKHVFPEQQAMVCCCISALLTPICR
jgi:glutamyl-tRNA reductase